MSLTYDYVCIGAHPDDVEIGMGATVAGLGRRGARVALVDLTDGEPTPFGTVELRATEASRAARTLGVDKRILLSGVNRFLEDTPDARAELAAVLRRLRPQAMFIPFPEDAHPDHVAAHTLCLGARFTAKLSKTDIPGEPYYVPRVYRYAAVHRKMEHPSSFLVDVSDDLETKMRALACYESQFTANKANLRVLEMVERKAQYFGDQAGCAAAEPFYAYEPVVVPSPELLS